MMNDLRQFLQTLFPELEGEFIEVRMISSSHAATEFFESTDALLEAFPRLSQHTQQANLFFGVYPRSRREGTKAAVKRVRCLFADVDGKRFPGGKEEALKRIREFSIQPTALVDSGHGYHPYYRFKELEPIREEVDVARIEGLNRALAHALGGDSSACDLARCLRLPDTYNLKDPANPLLVQIVELNPSRQYNPNDFEWLPLPPEHSLRPAYKALKERPLGEGERNATLLSLAGLLWRQGFPVTVIEGALKGLNGGFCNPPLTEKEVEGIVQSVSRYHPSKAFPFPSLPIYKAATETESKSLVATPLAKLLEEAAPEISWVVDRILPAEATAILAAPAGHGKSWMLLDLAIECARGGKWLGQFPVAPGRVLYLDEESSRDLLRHRLGKLLKAKELATTGLDVHFAVAQGLCLSEPSSIAQLQRFMEALRPKLVLIDSLIRVHRAEENSATEMSRVFSVVRDLVRKFSCSLVFADHQRKPSHFVMNQDLLLRGSTEKVAFVDALLSVQRFKGMLIVEHSKSRFAEPVQDFLVQIEDTPGGGTTIGYAGEADAFRQAERQSRARGFLLSVLKIDSWTSRKELVEMAKETKISEKLLDETLETLIEMGEVKRDDQKTQESRGGKAAFFRLVDTPDQRTNANEKLA